MSSADPIVPEEGRPWPLGLRRIVRWSERSLEPHTYWRDRYPDVLHERVDGFLSGVIVGFGLGWVSGAVVALLP